MQPQSPATANGYTPRWRQFPPQSIVWVRNPFDNDVDFQVADEINRPFVYTMEAHKISELPGGSIATLGVKKLVDMLMQQDPKAAIQIWDLPSRAKFETQIIMREKEAPSRAEQATPEGKISLTVKTTREDTPELPAASEIINDSPSELEEFPGLNNIPAAPADPPLTPAPAFAGGIDPDVASALASLPATGEDSAAGGE